MIEKSLPKSINKINIGEYLKDGLNPAYAWNKLYKREIWSKFKFKKMVYEDLELIIIIEGECRSISYIQEAFYTYCKRSGSTTTSYNKIQLLDIMTAYKNIVYNINPIYKKEAVFCVAKRILKNLDTPGMNLFKAEFIELINELKGEVNRLDGLAISSSFITNIEINDANATKGNILIKASEKMGIKREKVAVLGDGSNDYSMFIEFPNSFAMKNAIPEGNEYLQNK